MPFDYGWNKTEHDLIAFLGFLWFTVISEGKSWKQLGGDLDDEVVLFITNDFPLKKR